ncbi:MAG: enoyl-CoA hydratase-related protein [Bacteriovoracaceae bacterium]|nr:enoyl-CoA hydratase-related protein [Bacteriovoracaceae bacterium]
MEKKLENGKYFQVTSHNQLLVITLNRPEVKNAFNAEMIQEIITLFQMIDKQISDLMKTYKLIILKSSGDVFCAGADLNWMKEMKNFSLKENETDAKNLEKLFRSIRDSSLPVIGLIQGGCFGGGVGIAAACDIVFAKEKTATFCLSEIKLGLVPAVISPYVIAKMGVSQFKFFALSGETFSASRAMQLGLVHGVIDDQDWENNLILKIEKMFQNLPTRAMQSIKNLSNTMEKTLFTDAIVDYTTKLIANVRLGAEAQEGMSALLEKRKPLWPN